MSAHASGPRVGTVSNRVFGFGGERNAYEARFLSKCNFTSSDEKWIVKESRYEKTLEEEDLFHRKSLITQKWAELLAKKFNEQAAQLGLVGLPTISYMTCCYVKTKTSDQPAADEVQQRFLFAERKIEGEFRKWK